MKLFQMAAVIAFLTLALGARSQTAPSNDPFVSLAFLQGTWEAKSNGTSGVNAKGKYSFSLELKGHVMARHTVSLESCKGPDNYDCEHGDLLYVYPEGDGPLHAIYFDNEGHVIKYNVSTPSPTSAVFLSDGSQPGPQFRLVYERKAGTMSGKFQMRMPGQVDWHSYLEWSGDKK
jgi:hypothetical protein